MKPNLIAMGVTLATRDHTVLPSIRHKWTHTQIRWLSSDIARCI